MSDLFVGYAGLIWQTAYSALVYYQAQLATSPAASETVSLSEAMLATLLNGVEAINANMLVQSWQAEGANLQAIEALPLALSSYDTLALQNRTVAYLEGAAVLQPLLPQGPFLTPPLTIGVGQPLIPDMDLLGFYEEFDFETPPIDLTPANLIVNALAVAQSFTNIAAQISIYQGANLTQIYDVATRQALVANIAAGILNSFTSGPLASSDGFAPVPTFLVSYPNNFIVTELGAYLISNNASGTLVEWNQIVTLPALTMDASLIGTAPFSYSAQQNGVIRNTMLTMAAQIALFLMILETPTLNQINLVTVRVGDSLQDIANRALGDFEQWTSIAAVNSLTPPWIAATASPGVAGWGQQLLMPTPGISSNAAGTPPSYLTNFLGVDLYIGPINGVMPPWSGDFQTIGGYSNLSWALGRRLQTTLTTLIYHPDYGSRIPPEVGNIQDQQTAGYITAYAQSALLSDPRVAAVLSAGSTLLPNGLISFSGNVQPAGFGTGTLVNEVIGPTP